MRLCGRATGLKRLGELYELSQKSSMINAVVGEKGVGKTRLMMEFIRGRGGILYFSVENKETPLLLGDFKLVLERELGYSPNFESWDDFFKHIFAVAKSQHLVVILDEFQNLRKADKRAVPALRKHWDAGKGASKMLLLLVGSQFGEMRSLFLGRSAPFAGRASGFFKLTPLDYLYVRGILNDLGFGGEEKKVVLYSILGGIPYHYRVLEGLGRVSLEKLVTELFLKPGAPSKDEGFNVLERRFRAWTSHFSILQAIGSGKHTSVEIGRAIGFSPTTLSRYLAELVGEELIVRRVPVAEEESKSKRGRYFFADPLLRFWFKFIRPNRHLIEREEIEPVLAQVREHLDSFVGEAFRDVIIELLTYYNGRSLGGKAISFDKIGAWWARRGDALEVCATSGQGMLVGRVCWGPDEVGVEVARKLMTQAQRLKQRGKLSYLLVSKEGFTGECVDFMRGHDFMALRLADIERAFQDIQTESGPT